MTVSAAAADRRRRGSGLDPHSTTFAQFSDVLYAGVLVFALALPVVTWFAAFSAGVQVLREARETDGHVTAGAVWRAFVVRLLRHPIVHVVLPTTVTALLVLDVLLLPFLGADEMLTIVVPVVLASAAGAHALRIAGAWRPVPSAGRTALRKAWARMSEDATGTLLLAGAVAAAGAVVSIIPLMAVVLPGALALAAVAMDRRAETS